MQNEQSVSTTVAQQFPLWTNALLPAAGWYGRYALRGLPEGALFQLGGGPVGARENHAALDTFRQVYAPALGCGEPAGKRIVGRVFYRAETI